jgi:hypothetical protein
MSIGQSNNVFGKRFKKNKGALFAVVLIALSFLLPFLVI